MQMRELWFTKGFTVVAENFCKRCVTCNTHNVARGIKTPLASQPAPAGPFEILFGRPPFMGIEGGKQRLPATDVCENDMLNYCKEVSCLLSNISVQVKAEGC